MFTGSLDSMQTVEKNTPCEKEVVPEYSDSSFNLDKLFWKIQLLYTQLTLQRSSVACALNST